MAFGFIAAADFDSSGATTGTIAKPTGTADNDLMFAFFKRVGNADPTTVPTGWDLRGNIDISSGNSVWLWSRLAASEGASYDWIWAGSARTGGTIVTYRDGFLTSGPIDVVSATGYEVSSTTCRAASVSAANANSPIIWFGNANSSSSILVTTHPTNPTTLLEDKEVYSGASRSLRSISSGIWTGSGATGNMDGVLDVSTTDKNAFAVILVPSAGGATGNPYYAYAQQ